MLELEDAALALAIDPTCPDCNYVGTHGSGMFKSLDGGESWQQINQGLRELKIWDLVIAHGIPIISLLQLAAAVSTIPPIQEIIGLK